MNSGAQPPLGWGWGVFLFPCEPIILRLGNLSGSFTLLWSAFDCCTQLQHRLDSPTKSVGPSACKGRGKGRGEVAGGSKRWTDTLETCTLAQPSKPSFQLRPIPRWRWRTSCVFHKGVCSSPGRTGSALTPCSCFDSEVSLVGLNGSVGLPIKMVSKNLHLRTLWPRCSQRS